MKILANIQKTAERLAQSLKLTGKVSLGSKADLSPFWVGNTLVVIDNDMTTTAERSAIAKAKKINARAIAIAIDKAVSTITGQIDLDLDNFDANGNDYSKTIFQATTEYEDEPEQHADTTSDRRYSGRCGGIDSGGRC